ncbi:MAG: ABC transporter ATP-binding protein [Bacteroidales bacterium]|nr:ABC transporter ATP-binding protein [Bacteroidales bacterium]
MSRQKEIAFTRNHLKPYAARIAAYGLFVILSTLFMMATALSVSDFLKLLFEPDTPMPSQGGNLISQALEELYVRMIAQGKSTALWLFAGLLIVLFFFKNLFGYLSAVVAGTMRNRVTRDIRNRMFAKAMRLSVGYYSNRREGDVLSRFGNDIVEYEENVLVSIHTLASSVVTLVLYLLMLFYIDVRLTGVVLLSIPVISLVIASISRRLKRKSKEVQDQGGTLLSLTEEAIRGLRVIKAFNAIDFSNRRYQTLNHEYSRRRTAMLRRIHAASPVSEFLGSAVVVAVLLFGTVLVIRGGSMLTAELFVSYLMLFVLMLPPAKSLSTSVAQIKRGEGCVTRMIDFLEDQSIEAQDESKPAIEHIGNIELEGVAMEYPGQNTEATGVQALKGVDLHIVEGKTIAIVGMSGSGKSTIANLLLRFYDPTEGRITVDGRDIREYSLSSWRSRIGVVAQEPQLFNDSVANNIAYGMPNATLKQIKESARIADADDFIKAMPDGYDSYVGDGGAMLSGGQRQRICIARAVLRNPDLLIFDEATSALDSESELQVQHSIDTLLKGRTAVVIAHRLSTIRNADQIVVIDNGRVVECGTHEELLALGGIYHRMASDA